MDNTSFRANNNEKVDEVRTHDIPIADAMSEFMKQGWAPSPLSGVNAHPSIPYTKLRLSLIHISEPTRPY